MLYVLFYCITSKIKKTELAPFKNNNNCLVFKKFVGIKIGQFKLFHKTCTINLSIKLRMEISHIIPIFEATSIKYSEI